MISYNASDTRHIRAAEKAAKLALAERKLVVFNLMSSSAGRSWVLDLLTRCHIFQSPFTGVASRTDFNCGEQNIGLQLLSEIMAAAPDQYIQMMREASDKEQANGRRADDNYNGGPGGDHSDAGRSDNGPGGVEADYDPGPEAD